MSESAANVKLFFSSNHCSFRKHGIHYERPERRIRLCWEVNLSADSGAKTRAGVR
jgi:hypothetical protein